MKKIAMIGNSLSGIKALEELKSQGLDYSTVIISPENTFPYFRHHLSDLFSKKITQNKIFYRPNAEYEGANIKFIFEKKISRINFKRGRLTLEDKEQVDYDYLLVTDTYAQPFMNLKGANKAGLWNLKRLTDLSGVLKSLPIIETIVIQSDCLTGLKAAAALSSTNKEIILITSGKNVLNSRLDESSSAAVEALLQEAGVRLITSSRIVEILGDNDVKAIRLDTGKVYGCQVVLTDEDLPDLRIFKDTELQCGQRVLVNEKHQTNFDNVFALDAVCDRITLSDWDAADNYSYFAQEQGKIVASQIMGKEYTASLVPFSWTIEIKNNPLKFLAQQDLATIQLQREEVAVIS